MLTFDNLLASLPALREPLRLLEGPDVPPIRHVAAANPRFVAPLFREEIQLVPSHTSAILLTAPAALGKSTVASELAHRLNAPLLDLSRFQVGDGFIEGTIAKAYGRRQLGEVLDSVENGSMAIVFDALDEGEIRAGAHNFDAFMDDLCSLCQHERSKPTILLLARAETAILAELYFQEHDVAFASYVIDYFDEAGARQYLSLWLDDVNTRVRQADRAWHHEYEAKFTEATNLLFETLSQAVAGNSSDTSWDNDNVRSFLGYAPVLSALAEFLRVRNYNQVCQNLKDSPLWLGAHQSAWQVLAGIVQSLINREHDKLVSNIRPKLLAAAEGLGFEDWDSLYAIDEQMTRVLARVLNLNIPEPLPLSLPGQLRDPYEDAVDLLLPQHPFLSDRGFTSVVFEEFLYARALELGPDWLRDALRQRLRQSDHLPSSLLAYFMLESTSERPNIHADDVSVLCNSVLAGARKAGEVQMAILAYDSEVTGWVWAAESPDRNVVFRIDQIENGLTFWRRLSYCMVDAPTLDVKLHADQEFRIGPGVFIDSASLEIIASEFRVETGQPPGYVIVLTANAFTDGGTAPRIRVFGAGKLMVYWPNLIFPWVAYLAEIEGVLENDSTVAELYQHLRRILRGFRGSESLGGIGRSTQYIDAVAVGRGQMANSLRDHLVETGLLRRQASRYVLDTEMAAALGLSFTDLRGNRIPDLTRKYLSDFSKTLKKA
jgi:hypothetical protein